VQNVVERVVTALPVGALDVEQAARDDSVVVLGLRRVEDEAARANRRGVALAELVELERRHALLCLFEEGYAVERARESVVEGMRGVGRRRGRRAIHPAPLALMLDLNRAVADGSLPPPVLVGPIDAVWIEKRMVLLGARVAPPSRRRLNCLLGAGERAQSMASG
jgi:hypothetical protein